MSHSLNYFKNTFFSRFKPIYTYDAVHMLMSACYTITIMEIKLFFFFLSSTLILCLFVDLTQRDMVGLALLLGCDLCPQGVPGVGREGAIKLVEHCQDSRGLASRSCDLLMLFDLWVQGKCIDVESAFEQRIKKYASIDLLKCQHDVITLYLLKLNLC